MTKRTSKDAAEYITPAAATQIAPVTAKTLGRMADDGTIRARRLPSGHRRYNRQDVENLLSPVSSRQQEAVVAQGGAS